MFARRLEGRSLAGIARELNDRGVLCPSLEDPRRNRNRVDGTWSVTHPALVSETHFVAAQQVRAERATSDGRKRRHLLAGLLRCGHCGRRLDAHWVHGRAGCRCRHGYRSTTSRPTDAPEILYLQEDDILRRVTATIAFNVEPQERPGSTAEAISFLRSNATAVEVHGPATWALTNHS